MKKILLILCMLLFMTSVNAANEDTALKVRCDSVSGKVEVEFTADAEGKNAFVYISKMNPETLSDENIPENIIAVAIAEEKDGKYNAELIMSANAEKGRYYVVIPDLGAKDDMEVIPYSSRNASFYYADKVETESALNAVNNADYLNIDSVLSEYKDVFGIDTDNDYNENVGKAFVAERNINHIVLKNIKETADLYETAQAIGMMKSAEAEKLNDCINKYNGIIGLNIEDDYLKYAEEAAEIFSGLRTEIDEDGDLLEEIKNEFDTAVAIAALNNAQRSEADGVLKKYNDIFKLDLGGNYSKTDKLETAKALCGKSFRNLEDIKKAFNEKLSSMADNNNSGGSSGKTSGGSKGYVSAVPSVAPATPEVKPELFNDLSETEWAREAIENLAAKKVVSGYGDGSFLPNQSVKREEFVKMTMLAFGIYEEGSSTTFADVEEGSWYESYIASAQVKGILNGRDDNTVGIGENITRQEAAAILYRASAMKPADDYVPFEDDAEIADYAKEAVYTLRSAKIINGVDGMHFEPNRSITRAEAAQIIYAITEGTK